MFSNAQSAETFEAREEGAHLTPDERRVLLEDIGLIAFTLGQSLDAEVSAKPLQEAAISVSSVCRPRMGAITSPLERLHLLSALWQEIQPALAALLRGSDTQLTESAQSVRLAQARGGPKTTSTVARIPHLAAVWQQLHTTTASPLPPTNSAAAGVDKQAAAKLSQTVVWEARPALSSNTWANRLATRVLTDFAHEAAQLSRLASFCGDDAQAHSAMQVSKSARNLRLHPLLRDCPLLSNSETSPAQCADRILRCPLPYQTLYRAWRQLACPLDFDWTRSPLLMLPALEPWHLYEIWCLLQVAAALHRCGWKLNGGTLLQPTPRGLRLVPATGRASRLNFQLSTNSSLSLYYQPLFASANQQSARSEEEGEGFAFGSRSHAMQPDVVLHQHGWLIILDPKFRPYTQREDAQTDVNKMHTYRDAIVRRGSRNEPSPVSAAWCLFPGGIPYEEDICSEDVVAYPAASPQYPFGKAGVGALRLRPGDAQTTNRLAELLTFLLT